MSHMSDGVTNFGVHNIFRKNNFHDLTTSDCGSNSSNCHIDFIEAEPVTSGGLTRPTQYNLYEGNIIRNSLGSDNHAFLTQADACGGQCYGVIIRFNDMAHVGSYGILDDNAGSTSVPGFSYVKSYNNTYVDFNKTMFDAIDGFQSNSKGGAEVNNIFYFPETITDSPYYVDSTSSNGFRAGSNLAYCTGTCNFENRTQSGSFVSDAPGNLVANPGFVNYSANNFSLSAGSPAIGAGTYLATVATSDTGSGTSLVVNDPSFFQDGYGIPTVQADWIRVGPTVTVQIVSVNYDTNTLTLANSISRSPGDPVCLYKDSSGRQVLFGSAPDIGAYPYTGGGGDASYPSSPKNLRIR
jgi:hypothetical protein